MISTENKEESHNCALKCRDCKYYSGEENIHLCKREECWKVIKPDDDCRFLPETRELTCGDCWRLMNDPACTGYRCEESAVTDGKLCPMYIDKRVEDLKYILIFWMAHGLFEREKVNTMIDKFEKDYNELIYQVQ